jgi:hypothetical protein
LQPLPAARQDIALPDAAFDGGSTQMRQVGRDIEGASDQLDKIGTRIAEQDTTDKVLALDTQIGTGVLDFQRKINERKGVNAKGVGSEAQQWFDQTVQLTTATASPAVKRLFMQRAATQRMSLLDYANRYELQERDRATEETVNANTDTTINQAAADPTPDKVTLAIARLTQNYKALGATHGQTPGVVQANTAAAVAKLHSEVINGLAVNDPAKARAYFEEHKSELDGADTARLDKLTGTAVWQVQAQDLAAQVLAGKVTEQQALAEVRAKYQGDQQDIFVSAIRGAGNEVDSNLAKAQRETRLAAKNFIAGGGTLDKLPPNIAAGLDALDMANLSAYQSTLAKRGEPKTDPTLYDTLSRMTPAELLARQSSGQLLDDAKNLASSDWQFFENKASGKLSAGEAVDMPSTEQLLDGAHAQLGLVGDGNAAKRGQFDMAVRDALAQASKTKDGAPLTYDEKKKIVGDVIKGGVSSLWKPTPPDSMTQEQQLGQWFSQWRTTNSHGKDDQKAKDAWAPVETLATQEIRSLELAQGRAATQDDRERIWQRLNRTVQEPGKLYGTNAVPLYQIGVPATDRQEIIGALRTRKSNPITNPTELQIRELYAASIEAAQQEGGQ